MKQLLTMIAAALLFCPGLTAQPQKGVKAMDKAIGAFLRSKEVLTKSVRWSHSMEDYHFKYTVADNGEPVRQTDVQRLVDAFTKNVEYASAVYFHDHTDNVQPFGSVSFERSDNFFSGITGTYRLGDDNNLRIINFPVDKNPTSYGMLWYERTFTDRYGKPFRTVEGEIFKFYDGIWKMNAFHPVYEKGHGGTISVSKDDYVISETLLEQVRYLANMYAESLIKSDEQACDAVAYSLQSLCNLFEGHLSSQQFQNLSEVMKPFDAPCNNPERVSIIKKSVGKLRSRTEHPLRGVVMSQTTGSGHFISPDMERSLRTRYDMGLDDRPQVHVALTGCGSATSRVVTIARKFPHQKPYSVGMDNGRFACSSLFDKDQLLTVSDDAGHEMVIIADSVPMEIDLLSGTLTGSHQNERFAECQRRLKALELEIRKYAIVDNGISVMDEHGYNRLAAEAHDLQLQFVRENQDCPIAAWYLANNYYAMTFDELLPLMKRENAFADHVAMQPVWQFYEGLQKRQTGRSFTDASATDTAGVSRQLSEFVGHGDYMLLCYWDRDSREIMRTLKDLRKTCEGKNLNIVCVTLDHNLDEWKKYVRKRDLRFMHLMASPGRPDHPDSIWHSAIVKAYGVAVALPETILFDPDGRIVASGIFGDALKRQIERLGLQERKN